MSAWFGAADKIDLTTRLAAATQVPAGDGVPQPHRRRPPAAGIGVHPTGLLWRFRRLEWDIVGQPFSRATPRRAVTLALHWNSGWAQRSAGTPRLGGRGGRVRGHAGTPGFPSAQVGDL